MIKPPQKLEDMTYGTELIAGLSKSIIIADFDFETYSPAGFVWSQEESRWDSLPGTDKKGLQIVGAARYSEHPDAEVLCLAYDLKDGNGKRQWTPSAPYLPFDLFNHIRSGELLEAWNVSFEYWIWRNVCVPKYGFPPLPLSQLRCAMAKARAHALPGSLDNTGKVLNISNKKNPEGKRLIQKFCVPHQTTKVSTETRVRIGDDTESISFLKYNLQDIVAEAECSSLIPDLSPDELEFWQCDQAINIRGVQIDLESIKHCIKIIEQAYTKYNLELRTITNNEVNSASEIQKLTNWIRSQGVNITSLTADSVTELLDRDGRLPPQVKRALEIREAIGSAAVKKLYAMLNQVTNDGRLHDLFIYHSARTGRAAGTGPQPQNLPNSGPVVQYCDACGYHCAGEKNRVWCAWCGRLIMAYNYNREWDFKAVESALDVIKTGSLECVEMFFGDAVATVSGCLRGLFVAKPGYDLICSDYSAIEAVVLAALAGEEWRLEVFRTHGKIYEMSASKITGVPFEEFEKYKKLTGQHHPLRKTVGKVAELASGYQGWVGAWKQFGADEFFTDDEMKKAILAWREASPNIVAFWAGIENAAIQAILTPRQEFKYKRISYVSQGDILYCKLPSGRYITYHNPRLYPSVRYKQTYDISYAGYNSNPNNGTIGWIRMQIWGGRFVENIVQAIARDILAHAIVQLEKSGYSVVLHVHDEIASEISEGAGSIEEFEKIMSTMPDWANNWPISAKGGWRGKRYRK